MLIELAGIQKPDNHKCWIRRSFSFNSVL